MTVTSQVKILDDKVKTNKAQYDLDRQAAKISALSSGELHKYEYLTGEDLRYKSDVVQNVTFEYSPLGKVFNKGLDESNKQEGLLKRLKNIESKTEQKLEAIENQNNSQLSIESANDIVDEQLSLEAKKCLLNVVIKTSLLNTNGLVLKAVVKKIDFRHYDSLKELFKLLYYKKLSIEDAEMDRGTIMFEINRLDKYKPNKTEYVTARKMF